MVCDTYYCHILQIHKESSTQANDLPKLLVCASNAWGYNLLSSIIYLSNLSRIRMPLKFSLWTLTYQNQYQQLMCMPVGMCLGTKEEKFIPCELTGFICFGHRRSRDWQSWADSAAQGPKFLSLYFVIWIYRLK